jgi:hypothetical protein
MSSKVYINYLIANSLGASLDEYSSAWTSTEHRGCATRREKLATSDKRLDILLLRKKWGHAQICAMI